MILRRFLALALDVSVLSSYFVGLYVLHLMLTLDWTQTSNLIFVVSVVLYYACLEVFYGGKTFGKWLLHIHRSGLGTSSISVRQSVLRVGLAMFVPIWIVAAADLVSTIFFLEDRISLSIGFGAQIFGPLLWPVSVILSGGRSSIYDQLSGTHVQSALKASRQQQGEYSWRMSTISVLAAALCTIPAGVLVTRVMFPQEERTRGIQLSEKSSAIILTQAGVLPIRMANYADYLRGDAQFFVRKWHDSLDSFDFSRSVAADLPPRRLPDSTWDIAYRIDMVSEVTARGIVSDGFQVIVEAATLENIRRMVPQGTVGTVVIVFTFRYSLTHFYYALNWDDHAVAVLRIDEAQRVELLSIREPDAPVSFGLGFAGSSWWTDGPLSRYGGGAPP